MTLVEVIFATLYIIICPNDGTPKSTFPDTVASLRQKAHNRRVLVTLHPTVSLAARMRTRFNSLSSVTGHDSDSNSRIEVQGTYSPFSPPLGTMLSMLDRKR